MCDKWRYVTNMKKYEKQYNEIFKHIIKNRKQQGIFCDRNFSTIPGTV